ncbi:MAG TPA: hypothetical protein VFG83_10425 [Kofleriaceae bacterium]|nr:hypothetical protein [Kofleriaceae bacterium]
MTRLLVANLAAEASLGGVDARLPEAVWQRIAGAGAYLAVLARPGDRLWLPRRAAMPAAVTLPAVDVVFGDLAVAARGAARILAWCETAEIAAVRSALPAAGSSVAARGWIDALWTMAPPPPAVVARCNHRRFGLKVADDGGWALAGTTAVTTIAELEAWVAAGGARLGGGAWVAKAPQSCAGRDRARGSGAAIPADVATRLARLLSRHRELLVEPWCQRTLDFGVAGLIEGDRVRVFAPHRQEVDGRGTARAIVIDDDSATWLSSREIAIIDAAAHHTATALSAAGFRGAFGIDGFRYIDPAGIARLCPLLEINARLTFGHLARALFPGGGTLPIA